MKIAVCGSGTITDNEIAEKAFEIGREIARKNILLLTGAGTGYPYEAAKGAFSSNGSVLGVSPAKDREEHVAAYGFPIDSFTEIEFTSLGVPGRNYPLIKEADAIIIISGQTGTLNEFTIAFHECKVIGVLENSGGITEIITEIAEICKKKDELKNMVYSSEPRELVQKVLERFRSPEE